MWRRSGLRLVGMAKKKSRPTPVPPEPLAELFDSHTHLWATVQRLRGRQIRGQQPVGPLESEEYAVMVKEIMDRAEAVGVRQVCTIGDGIEETERAVEAAHVDPRVWAAVAVHPTLAHTVDDAVKARLVEMSRDPRVVAIGETGLDTYWIGKETDGEPAAPPLEVQEEAFRWHIDLAVESGKALMIHNREADGELMAVLDDAPRPKNVILHCFSSPLAVAEEALSRGYVLSFSGNVSFKGNGDLREAARVAPAEQILIETDAPFMTPEPFRGVRNEPAYVGYTARVVAEARGMDAGELGKLTADNARRVFGI